MRQSASGSKATKSAIPNLQSAFRLNLNFNYQLKIHKKEAKTKKEVLADSRENSGQTQPQLWHVANHVLMAAMLMKVVVAL
jgi:hypothetical protein